VRGTAVTGVRALLSATQAMMQSSLTSVWRYAESARQHRYL
jgi:hypothetical protein